MAFKVRTVINNDDGEFRTIALDNSGSMIAPHGDEWSEKSVVPGIYFIRAFKADDSSLITFRIGYPDDTKRSGIVWYENTPRSMVAGFLASLIEEVYEWMTFAAHDNDLPFLVLADSLSVYITEQPG